MKSLIKLVLVASVGLLVACGGEAKKETPKTNAAPAAATEAK